GSITFQAGDSIFVTGTVAAAGRLFFYGDYRNADPGVGGTVQLAGTITGSEPEVTGDEDADLLDGSALTLPLTMFGRGGADSLLGGSAAGLGGDLVWGEGGADTIYGNRGDETLYGHNASGTGDDAARDVLFGEWGDDELHGNAGDDELDGGFGSDRLFGDAGNDDLKA